MRNSSSKLFFKNAFIIAAGGFIAKILGALYRIPLTNLLGGTGMGLYQMVFPVYCILLDFAGAGLPCGLSKLISANVGEDAEIKNVKTFKTAFLLMSAIGAVGSLAMFFVAKPLAIAQGNGEAYLAYTALSPAVFFVALISCYRGYFQGRQMMMPTALSQIIEQLVKLGAGLGAVKLLLPSAPRAAAGAAFAVTLSEVAAFIMLAVMYRRFKTGCKLSKEDFAREAKGIFKICLPVTLVSVLLPLSQVADSFLIINILGRGGENATSLYGLFSGGVMSVIGVPVSICYGIAVSALPAISKSNAENGDSGGGISLAVGLTALLSAAMAAFCYFFPNLIIRILFFGLGAEEKAITAGLLKMSSFSVMLLSLVQTTNSVLVGKNKPYLPMAGLLLGIAAKLALEALLLPMAEFGIYAAAFSANVCYFVAVFVNLLYIIRATKSTAPRAALNKEGL